MGRIWVRTILSDLTISTDDNETQRGALEESALPSRRFCTAINGGV